ncbi:MAG TPA: hypothetical protein V6D03_13200 [Candidatus Caenarcaniphilales bacterium]
MDSSLLSIGDGHLAQGSGEINVIAIETVMSSPIKLQSSQDKADYSPLQRHHLPDHDGG